MNEYKILDDITSIIFLKNKKGEVFDCFVDTKNLGKLLALAWHLKYDYRANKYYANTTIYLGSTGGRKYTTKDMQSFLLDTEKNKIVVDHINGNRLDNRESNLRVCKANENTTHRKARNSNNKTGYRNVCFTGGIFVVQLQVNGRNKVLGRFDDVDEAGAFAEEMRQKYYRQFSGSN